MKYKAPRSINNPSVFPSPHNPYTKGIGLEDELAARCMEIVCRKIPLEDQDPEEIARCAYRQARAMLQVRGMDFD